MIEIFPERPGATGSASHSENLRERPTFLSRKGVEEWVFMGLSDHPRAEAAVEAAEAEEVSTFAA